MNKEACEEVCVEVRRFVDERVDRIRRIPDLNMSDEEKVYWIDRFNFAGQVVVTFASITTNIMKEKDGEKLFTMLREASMKAKRKVTGSAL